MVILMDSVVCSCCIGFVKSMLYFIKKIYNCLCNSKIITTFARFLYGGDCALVPKNGCGRP